VSVTANDDWFGPAGDKTGNILADDWLPENGASEDVSDRAIGRLPHLLQFEF